MTRKFSLFSSRGAVLLVAVYLLACNTLHAQIISTIAGTGTNSFSGDGAAATAAEIGNTFGVITDAPGNVYFTDASNNRIRKMDLTGIITTIAGTGAHAFGGDGGLATDAQIAFPSGLSLDTNGNLYFSDANNSCVRKVTPAGYIYTIAGIGGMTGFGGDGGPATNAQIGYSDGVFADRFGNVIIPDPPNHRIRKVNSSGIISTIAGNGILGYAGDGGQATDAELTNPADVRVDDVGNLYFTDFTLHVVRMVKSDGIISTIAGTGSGGYSGDGGPATAAMLDGPVGIDVDHCGNVYIGDRTNNRVRKITTAGIISTLAGGVTPGYSGDGGAATLAGLYYPHGVHIDGRGNIFIADRFNYRIRKISTSNHIPAFLNDSFQTLGICGNTTARPIDSLLPVIDSDLEQNITWKVAIPPMHGTLNGFPTVANTNASLLVPSGLTYTPAAGYVGHDTFMIYASDCFDRIDMPVFVTIDTARPHVGTVSGIDSVCPGKNVTLTASVPGGKWLSTNPAIGTVSTIGVVTGITTGLDTIRYILSNPCGADTANYPFIVRAGTHCGVGVEDLTGVKEQLLTVVPNPSKGVFFLNLSAPADEMKQVVISNVIGEKLKELVIRTNTNTEVKLDSPPGIYFISALTASGRITAKILLTD